MARQHDIRLRRSNTAGAIPTDSNLNLGELAINTADGALYFKKSDGTVITAHDNTILHIDSDASNSGANPKVGIGTTSPNQKLTVAGKIFLSGDGQHVYFGGSNTFIGERSNSTHLQLRGGGTNTASTVYINSSGNIGLGTVNPSRRIHAVGSGATVGIKIEATDGSQASLDLTNTEGAVRLINDGGAFQIYDDTDTAQRLHISTAGAITFNNAFTFPTSIGSAGQVLKVPSTGSTLVWADDTGGSGSADSLTDLDGDTLIQVEESADEDKIRFDTAGTERMIITHEGKVGIGTPNPSELFDIESAGSVNLEMNNTGNSVSLKLGAQSTAARLTAGPGDRLGLGAGNTADILNIASDANVGIGTTSPARNLHIHEGDSTLAYIQITNDTTGSSSLDGVSFGITGDENAVWINRENKDSLISTNNTERLRIKADGKVGIGTATPATNLHISESSDQTSPQLRITNDNSESLTIGVVRSVAGTAPDTALIQFDNALRFIGQTGTTNERMRITEAGNVGIGEDNPLQALHVSGKQRIQSKAADSSSPALHITDNADDVADQNYTSIHLDYNISGSDALATTDRNHRGMLLDIDSSASGGDTSNEHRIYGIDVDLDFNGDSDQVIGAQFHTENNNADSIQTQIFGLRSYAVNDTSGTARGTNTYGAWIQAQANHTTSNTDDANLTAIRARTLVSTSADGGRLNDLYGVYSEVEIDDPGQALDVDNVYVGRFTYNNDDTANNNVSIDNAYLVFGDYGGGAASTGNSFGVYMSSTVPKHYFGSNVGIGTTSPDALLEVSSDSDDGTNAPIVKITNESTTLADGAVVGTLQFVNKDATSGPHIGHIQGIANSGDERSVELAFATGNVGTTSERLRITSSGKVGIGTTGPAYHLDIDPTSSTSTAMRVKGGGHASLIIDRASTSYDSNLSFVTAGTTKWRLWNDGSDDVLQIRDEANSANVMSWKTGGNVGIGNSSPSAKLHVDGSTGIIINDSATASTTQTQFLPINSAGNSLLKVKGGNYIHSVAYETSWNDFEYAKLVSSYNTSDSRFDLKKSASDGTTAATTRISTGTSYFNGDVGIGTTSPGARLQVNGSTSDTSATGFIVRNSSGNSLFSVRNDGRVDIPQGNVNITNNLTVSGNTTITGNLTVDGTTTTLNTATLDVEDKNITLNYGSGDTSATANGAGITIQDAIDASTDATILWNTSADAFKFSHKIRLDDGISAQFGNSADLQIYHDGSNSFISNGATGSLRLTNGAGAIQLRASTVALQDNSGYNYLATEDLGNGGIVKLYHGSVSSGTTEVFRTASNGVEVTGTLNTSGAIVASGDGHTFYSGGGSSNASFGRNANERLQIYVQDSTVTLTADQDSDSNGQHDFILDRTFDGTGANNFRIRKGGSDQLVIDTNANATFSGTLTSDAGVPQLILKTSGTETGYIRSSSNVTQVNGTSGVALRHNASTKLETTSSGVTVTGSLVADTIDVGGDLTLDADGGDVILKDGGTEFGRLSNVLGGLTLKSGSSSANGIIFDTSGNIILAGNITGGTGISTGGRIKTTDGMFSANEGSRKLRQYHINTGDAGGDFLLGQIEYNDNNDGAVEGIIYGAYDYGSTDDSANIHFQFAQRDGVARGHWWYEHDDQDGTADRVHVRLIDDGSGGMYVWLTCVDFAEVYVDCKWRHINSDNQVSDSGTLTSGTLTTGTTLFDTANDPTSQHHIGKLYAHDDINLPDNKKVNYGSSNDLQIYHDGTGSLVRNYTGDLYIQNDQDDGDIYFKSDNASGGTTTYLMLDGGQAQTRFLRNAKWEDNKNALFGTNDDLQLFHDGSNSYVSQQGTGNLVIRTTVDDGDIVFQSDDGSGGLTTYLQLDGSAGQTRFSANTLHFDNVKALFGNSSDLQIYHDGSNSYIKDGGTGNLRIDATDFYVRNSAGTQLKIGAVDSGAVNLYYAGSKKFETTSTGIAVTGNAVFNSSAKVIFGGDDTYNAHLQYTDNGSGDHFLSINTEHDDTITTRAKFHAGTGAITFTGNTTFANNLTVTGNFTVDGTTTTLNTATLDVEDKNITLNKGSGDTSSTADGAGITIQDAVSSSTDATILWNASSDQFDFSHHIKVPDSKYLKMGDDNDFIIYHDGTTNYIQAVKQDSDIIFRGNDGGTNFNALHLDMSASGSATFNGSVTGVSSFFQNVYITSSGSTATNRIDNDGNLLYITYGGGSQRAIEIGNTNGEVKLKYATNTKLETTSSGVTVTGNIAVSGTVDGRDVATDGSKLDGIESGATADQTQSDINALGITQVGTITSGTWNGSVIASAYLDSDTAHLSGSQTFTGVKTFNSNVIIGNATYASYGSGSTDITGLIGGSTFGSIQYASGSGHHVIGLRDNDNADSFAVISGSGNYNTDSTYDKLVFRAEASGQVTVGGNLDVASGVDVTGNITVSGTVDGVDIAARNSVLTSTTTTANAALPKAGGTMSGNIAMGNYNITGVNQLEINDPGEGIVFKQGSSGDMVLKIIDDSSDNILQYSGTSAVFDVAGTITTDALTNSGNTTLSGNIRQTLQNVGIPTVYGQYTMEATDAQMDLVSSSSGTWGSAINFVEGASTSANTDVWSIARKTTGGDGDSSLNFNFGTSNQHVNTNRVAFSSGGNITLTGTVDGRDVATDGTKLDTIATNADVTPSWVPSSDPGYLTSSSTQDKYLRSDATDTASGVITFSDRINLHEIRSNTGQEVIINVGESHSVAASQTGEYLYVNADNGLQVNVSPDNWSSGWAGRKTLTYDGTNGLVTSGGFSVDTSGNLSATTKSFDIEHPTKEGKRLRYGVLEGPENGVYIRGRTKDSVIELPDYWTGLVHEDSITVQLTPIGKSSELYVEDISDNKVLVSNDTEYFYYIMGERKDVERFEVEYDS